LGGCRAFVIDRSEKQCNHTIIEKRRGDTMAAESESAAKTPVGAEADDDMTLEERLVWLREHVSRFAVAVADALLFHFVFLTRYCNMNTGHSNSHTRRTKGRTGGECHSASDCDPQ
jgi:hypothetical protein